MKLPQKILTFIWKFLHESLPVFEVLNNRGILFSSNCLICNEENESLDHLFMKCPFTRAIWHGSNLAIRSSELQYRSVKQWVKDSILQNDFEENGGTGFIQSFFTIMWSIWNHRNRVLHQGILPIHIEVILTSQSLTCRYQEAFQTQRVQETETTQQQHPPFFPSNQEWQLNLKVAV